MDMYNDNGLSSNTTKIRCTNSIQLVLGLLSLFWSAIRWNVSQLGAMSRQARWRCEFHNSTGERGEKEQVSWTERGNERVRLTQWRFENFYSCGIDKQSSPLNQLSCSRLGGIGVEWFGGQQTIQLLWMCFLDTFQLHHQFFQLDKLWTNKSIVIFLLFGHC